MFVRLTGYLYKYWVDKYCMNPVDGYNMARPSEINDKYLSLYNESYICFA